VTTYANQIINITFTLVDNYVIKNNVYVK